MKMEINQGWQFKQARQTNWYPATVPGVVHTDLIDNKIIEDPFFRLNERGLQWIDKEDWIYQTTFDLTADIFDKKNIDLVFEGLDTYADVYLNDEKIVSANNMFRTWSADVKRIAKQTGNVLRIYFHSPIKVDMPKWLASPYKYEAVNDQSENGGLFDMRLSVYARKAGYHYGWDWGPRLVTSGIWRPVFLRAWDDARIENVQVMQESVTRESAHIRTIVEVTADKEMNGVLLDITDEDTGKSFGQTTTSLQSGLNRLEVSFSIRNPKLWWSAGLGDPHLYRMAAKINLNNKIIDKKIEQVGIRSLKFINEKDESGKSFYFVLNGIPVFAKGANYIPSHNFLPEVTRAAYEKTVGDAVKVNMNMLRIWGGGIYEDDYFYELCDRNGILVWQDFMFACSLYPAEGELLENIRQEAIDNVRRLRNHPCIAIWCGNNECQDAWFYWGWKYNHEKQNQASADTIWEQYKNQYFKVLPEVVAEYGSGISYTPSSPFADYDNGSNDMQGDRHYWGVWHGKEPIANYNKERSRFFSEYGMQSFPEFESVKKYAPEPEDWEITSEVMMAHQRGGENANKLIESYLLSEYYEPRDFQSFLYINHILQGDAVKTAIESHRRDMGYCMGTLFWQHNDCWPVASWSSRDYYGRWKALHYFCKPAYDPVLVSPILEDGKLNVYIVSDLQKESKGKLIVEAINLNGGTVNAKEFSVTIRENRSQKVFSADLTAFVKNSDFKDIVIHAKLTANGRTYRNNYFLLKQKEINYPEAKLAIRVEPAEEGYRVSVTSDKFARGVCLSLDGIDYFVENNYFDILPEETVSTHIRTAISQEELERQLKTIFLNEMK